MGKFSSKDKFNFFIPLSFEKGSDGNGQYLLKVKGVASTLDEDSDGEELDCTGFDCTELLTTGFINWNHKASQTSAAICGKPTAARIIKKGKGNALEIEGVIYNNTEGRAVAELIQVLENDPDRQIGWSIEGRKKAVDPFNSKRITQAYISGVALTHCPKNKNTFVSILKGEYSEPFVEETEEEETEKAISTETISATVPESVENSKKGIEKSSNFEKLISKSNIYLSIAKQYPTASIAETKSIYTLIQEVNSKMFKMENNQKVYPEAIQKAFDLLNNAQSLIKGEETTEVITKGEDKADEEEVEKALPFAEMLSKAGFDKDKACDTMCKGGISLVVAQGAWEKVISAANAAKDGDTAPEQVTAPIVKGEEFQPLYNIQDEIKKSLEPFSGTLTGITDAIQKGFDSFNEIVKGYESERNILIQRIEKLESTPNPVKSITANNAVVADRFQKSNDTTQLPVGTEAYNVNNREDLKKLSQRLMDEIEVNYIQKGKEVDPLLEGTINHIEIGHVVPQFAFSRLRAMGIILQQG